MAVELNPLGPTSGQGDRDQAVKEIMSLLKKGDVDGARRVFDQAHKIYGAEAAPQPMKQPRQSANQPMQLPPEAR